jgi:signal transduction histidine kinase
LQKYLNHTLLFVCIGAILLAAIYHTILFLHRKESLLRYYSQYLWVLLFYLGYRVDAAFNLTGLNLYHSIFNWDEVIQMLSFMYYIIFLGYALFYKKEDSKYTWYFYKATTPVILCYCVLILVFAKFDTVTALLAISLRIFLLAFGFFSILIMWGKRESLYYKYLFAAAICVIILGFTSSLSMILEINFFGMGPFHWLLISFFLDVVFFSAALGYRIRQEYLQRENSLKQLLTKEAELQQKELEKMKAVYETREEERMRIARDLHDDMGSTLSSIGIYSKVVATYVDTDKAKANEYLEKIQYNTKLLMENTGDLIWSLQTNYGQSESIFKRMQSTGIELLSLANIAPHFTLPHENDLPLLHVAAQKNCWLIFKEAINNVCKYSKAANCTVLLAVNKDKMELTITDDGNGFTGTHVGNGLANMRQRTEALGGAFTVESNPGKGTAISFQFQLHKILMPV